MPFCDIQKMTRSPGDNLIISTPFARRAESVNSSRYYWESDRRGDQQFVIIQQTLSGVGSFALAGKYHAVPDGCAFICLVPEPSAYRFPEASPTPWKFSWLNFYGSLALQLCRQLRDIYGPVLPLPSRSVPGAAFHALVTRAEQRLARDPHDTTLASLNFLVEWKRLLDHPQMRPADSVALAQRICQTHFREPLGIKELAAQTGLSREHLTRIFTDRMGTSPARYLRKIRAHAARRLLRYRGMTLKEAALRCGFSSTKALHRALSSENY